MKPSHRQIKRASVVLLLCLAAVLIAPGGSGAHEPITTKILFNKEVIRVLQRNCLGCHRPGGIAPMSLATYEEARPWAKAIKEELLEKRMPPSGVMKGFGDFRNSFPITQREIDLIVNWVEGGAPAGKPDLLPPGKLYSDDWRLGKPDLILKPKTSQKISSDTDDYREIFFPIRRKGSISIRAIDVRPEKQSVVHCAIFYAVSTANKKLTGDESPGAADRRRIIGTWVPGQAPFQLPEGTNISLPAGSALIARIHYRGSGEATKDESEIGLYLSKTEGRQVTGLLLASNSMLSADRGRGETRSTTWLEENLEVIAISPQSGPALLSLQVTAYRPDGAVDILAWTKSTQFDWQPTLVYKNPISLPKGTSVELVAYNEPSRAGEAPKTTALPKQPDPSPACVLYVLPAGGGGKAEPTQAQK